MKDRKTSTLFPYLAGGVGIILCLYLVVKYRMELRLLYTSPSVLRHYVESWGIYGPLLFMGLQVLQVVVFIIPGEVTQISGGYLFGFWHGSLYSVLGITLGSTINFFAARVLGKPVILRLFGEERVEGFMRVMDTSRAKGILLVLFLLPGFPKDLLCYVVGLTAYRFPYFLLVSITGRLPALLFSSYLGDAAALHAWKEVTIATALAAVLLLGGMVLRWKFMKRNPELKTPGSDGEPPVFSGSPPEEV